MATNKTVKKHYKTCIDDLPNELLTCILSNLVPSYDLDNVQQVCQRWYAVVDQTIGREIAITSWKSYFKPSRRAHFPCLPPLAHHGSVGFDMISKIGVRACYVDLPKEDGPTEGFSFKYPHLLRQLHISSGAMTSAAFKGLLKDTENLLLLQLNLMSLSQLDPVDLSNLKLPLLRILSIGKYVCKVGETVDEMVGLPYLSSFLKQNVFPSLVQLDIRFLVAHFKDFELTKSILKFIMYSRSLTQLNAIIEFPSEVKILENYQTEQQDLIDMIQSHQHWPKLSTCEILAMRLHATYPHLHIWQAFLSELSHLNSLALRLGHLTGRFLDKLCANNQSTLESLLIYKLNETVNHGQDVFLNVLDCRAFSPAINLQTLYALGSDVIMNAKSLPITLSTIFLTGELTTVDAEYLFFEMPCLSFVSLRNAFRPSFSELTQRTADTGITLDMLKRFLQERRIHRLILNRPCLLDEYPSEGLSNGHPESPVQLMYFDSFDEDCMYLDWELGLNGYYMDKSY